MWMWITGSILIVVGIMLLFARRSQSRKLADVLATETSSCARVADMCKSMAGASGLSGQQVEIKGFIEPREVLTSELGGQECVCYRSKVEREYEEKRWETDSQGRRRRRTRRGSETVSDNKRLQPFFVRDDTGQVLVDPGGASLDWVESLNRFQRGEAQGGVLSLGGFSLNLGGLNLMRSGRRTLGYRYREWILAPRHAIYVLGEAANVAGEPCVQRQSEGGGRFIVSVKSEEQIIAGAEKAILWLSVGAGASLIAALTLLILWLVRK